MSCSINYQEEFLSIKLWVFCCGETIPNSAGQYFQFIRATMLPKGALEDVLSNLNNKDAQNTF